MRLIKTAAVLILLVGLPIVSWYYLSTGADWRRDGWKDMEVKGAVEFASVKFTSGEVLEKSQLNQRYMIIGDIPAGTSDHEMQGLADQFGYRDDLVLFNLQPVSGDMSEKWQVADCGVTDCEGLRSNLFAGSGDNVALVDSASNLRNTYDLGTEVRMLIKHGAILFPTEKREKLELKRGTVK